MPDLAKLDSMQYPEKRDFDLVSADFGEDINNEIEHWLRESIRSYKEAYQVMFTQKVPQWRETYMGKPKDESKSFPWPNASNLVVQVVGQSCDDLAARVLQIIWGTSPTAYFRYLAKSDDPKKASELARILEQFIDVMAFEPDDLDLYRVECQGFADSAKLGTNFFKVIPEKRTEVKVVEFDAKTKRTKLESEDLYNGPKVDTLDIETVLGDPDAPSWDKSRLKVHIRTLKKHDLQQRGFEGFYDKDKVEEILKSPDRFGPTWEKQREKSKKGVNTTQSTVLAEWDVYECYFWWYITVKAESGKPQNVKANLIWSYHYESRTVLRQVFNFMPDNACPIIPTKLDISSKGIHGRGYAEMLDNSQQEVSTQHNQRIDARTMAITGILRSSNPNLDKNLQVYPFCIIPAAKDELEHIKPVQDIGDGGITDEELTLRLAAERAGVGPAVAGMGAGGPTKKGQYGSMGTLAVMSDGNTRVNHRISDFRHAHVKILTLVTKMYGKMGTGGRAKLFGLDEGLLNQALKDFLDKKIRIPIRAATASANKEVEKQNDMLLSQLLTGFHEKQIQLVQAIQTNTSIPPPVKAWMLKILESQNALMRRTLRNFGYDQPDLYVPDTEEVEKLLNGSTQGQQPPNGQPPRFDPSAALSLAQSSGPTGPSVPSNGGGGLAAILPGLGEPSNHQ